jgi:hypothetical protein
MATRGPAADKSVITNDTGHPGGLLSRARRFIFGKPRDIADKSLFHRLALVPFLAWVGLGADGLSSSAYGPEEAFRNLGEHTYLALGLAVVMALTVGIIALAESFLIEEFPHGGGGYVVATKLLAAPVGAVSGCALLVDYVLTITISIAAAGDALFSFVPIDLAYKVHVEALLIAGLTVLNIRGVRESVLVLMPIFVVFLITHAAVIFGGIAVKLPEVGHLARSVGDGFCEGLSDPGLWGLLVVFLHAYSLGGGTYTGIEAVANGLPIMREPRVATGKRTMLYMAISLAITASGLLLGYLLWGIASDPEQHKTMNALLVERLFGGLPAGAVLIGLTLAAEGALLVVAAQAGLLAGPRVLANMAHDSWMPRRFSNLSERLTTRNGIVLMGVAALVALFYTGGNVRQLVVMYSINVFLTFSLSQLAMTRFWIRERRRRPEWKRRLPAFVAAFVLCATILVVTVVEKFREGGWITLAVTSAVVALCFLIRGHYRHVAAQLGKLYSPLEEIPSVGNRDKPPLEVNPAARTAAVLVGGYSGVGIHTVLNAFRLFPGDFKNVVFLSVGVIDSGIFKGEQEMQALRAQTEAMLRKYCDLARRLGVAATYRLAIGTDLVAESERLCLEVSEQFPHTTFFIGKVIFKDEVWYHRFLHNNTAFAVQRRLEWAGKPMVIVPVRVE